MGQSGRRGKEEMKKEAKEEGSQIRLRSSKGQDWGSLGWCPIPESSSVLVRRWGLCAFFSSYCLGSLVETLPLKLCLSRYFITTTGTIPNTHRLYFLPFKFMYIFFLSLLLLKSEVGTDAERLKGLVLTLPGHDCKLNWLALPRHIPP